jgi:hypothetical protein
MLLRDLSACQAQAAKPATRGEAKEVPWVVLEPYFCLHATTCANAVTLGLSLLSEVGPKELNEV